MHKTRMTSLTTSAIDDLMVFLNSICSAYAALPPERRGSFIQFLQQSTIVEEATVEAAIP